MVVTSSAPMTAGIVFEPKLDETQWHGIRAMHYSRAVKVGLAFSDSWWKSKEFTHIGLAGGISTDLNFYEMWIPPTKEDVSNGNYPGLVIKTDKTQKKTFSRKFILPALNYVFLKFDTQVNYC